MSNQPDPLVVDLDGTLVRTDLFLESVMRFIRRSPLNLFRILLWLLQGRQLAKVRIAASVAIDASRLPYNQDLITLMQQRKAAGAELILATAAPERYGTAVAEHLDCFDCVIASDELINAKGPAKLHAIRAVLGERPFEYAGDDPADQPIWDAASAGIYVNVKRSIVADARRQNRPVIELRDRNGAAKNLVRQLRIHQWVKNLLVLLPLFAAHTYTEPGAVFSALLGFVCFSFCASGVYVVNDLFDLAEDRAHPSKRHRPLAAGELSIRSGVLITLSLMISAVGLAAVLLPSAFTVVLLTYLLTNYAYSVYLKRIWAVDAMVLAGMYTLRILAGAAALGLFPSFWLLSFSMFAFLGLAYLKRYVEIMRLHGEQSGRGYHHTDHETLFSLGISNMTVSVLVLALYIRDVDTTAFYGLPEALWGLCLIGVYWSNRVWFKARRVLIDDDPIVWALKDPVSIVLVLTAILLVIVARYGMPFA